LMAQSHVEKTGPGLGAMQDILLAKGRGRDVREVWRIAKKVAWSRKAQGGGGEELVKYYDRHVQEFYAYGQLGME
jgi:hypothetical protein